MSFLASDGGGRGRIVGFGDEELVEDGWVVDWPLAMTDDARVVARQLSDPANARACVAVGDRRGETFDAVGAPVLSADGAVIAYRAQLGNAHFVVTGTQRGPAFDFVKDPALSPDGACVAYAAARGRSWLLVVDGEERSLACEPEYVFVGPDRSHVGWTFLERRADGGSTVRVVAGNLVGEPFDLVGLPVWSPSGEHVAYLAQRGERWFLVVDARALEVEGRPRDPVWSHDGHQIGYGTRIDRELWWHVRDVH